MTTHVTTSNPVRSDVPSITPDRTRTSRSWALAGIGAGLASVAGIVSSGMVGAVYDKDLKGDPALIQQALADDTPAIFAFHTFALLAAVLLLVFVGRPVPPAAGGRRRQHRARWSPSPAWPAPPSSR